MTGTYEIIYADPPWRYSAKKVQGAAENHYPTMSIDELCALPVAELAAKDSALFMWATFPQLPEALRLIRAWGFTYKSVAFVWLKKNKKADMSVGNPTGVQYLRCSKRADSKSCDGCGTLRTREFERFLYGEMVKKLSEFQTLTAKRETVNPKLTALNMELARVEDEIEKLLNTLTGANAVLLSYANSKIEELDTRRQALTKEIAALSAETMSPEQIERLSVYLNQWEEIDFEDRRQVADGLISQIRATDEHVSIEWKI